MRFDALHQELVQSTDMIRALLAGITEDEARIKPSPESWSVLEVLGHLYDEEREDFREHLDFILNRPHEDWHGINPAPWVTTRKYNEQEFGAVQRRFLEERAKSLDWLKTVEKSDWDATYVTQWGARSAGDMLVSWIAHDNLAIRQLVELRRHRIEEMSKPYSIDYAGEW